MFFLLALLDPVELFKEDFLTNGALFCLVLTLLFCLLILKNLGPAWEHSPLSSFSADQLKDFLLSNDYLCAVY